MTNFFKGGSNGNRQTSQAVHGSSNQAPRSSLTVTACPPRPSLPFRREQKPAEPAPMRELEPVK
jgi:hypothetical protein